MSDMRIPSRPVVLIVDDSPEYLSLLGSALASTCTVRVASSGRRALQLAAQDPVPDLVLLDVLMPDMDGHAVLAALRSEPRTRDMPAIFVTSLDDEGEETAALGGGAADYIVKPAPAQVVRARVQTQIELKRVRDELRDRNAALQQEVERRGQLQQALQATIAELEAFSYSVSHDLRAPLAAIGAFAESVSESDGVRLSIQGRHRLGRIVEGARRMGTMIDDILACTMADRAAMHCGPVDLNQMAADVVRDLEPLHPDASVMIAPLPTLQADPTMLRQVLSNLIGNALKFSSHNPAARVEIRARPSGEATEILVRDNGAGFDPAYGHKLFGLFQRLHTTGEFPGTGVGLAIVKRLVARHGGKVRAESVPGGWTTFAFSLQGRGGRA
jgi:signal transduction histidine kinase